MLKTIFDCDLEGCYKLVGPKSKYCSDAHRLKNAHNREQERKNSIISIEAKPANMTTEEFYEHASKFLNEQSALPDVPNKILATKVEDMGFNTPQCGVAVFSDYHFGSLVDPRVTGGIGGYNVAIARSRLADWRDGILRFTQIMQATTTVTDLHILALGDDMEGNGHMFPTQALQMEMPVYFQYLGFVEDMVEILVSLLQRYEKIHIYKVFGNHGRLSGSKKDSFDPDNFELMAWQTIAARLELAAPGRFTCDISSSFFMVIDIMGWEFYIRHGDGINLRSTYTGPLHTKLAVNSILGKVIPYMIFGHHHTASEDEAEIDGDILSNGCFVGPSLLSLKMRQPKANRPSQEIFFVHPKHGITHRQRIHLATREELRQVEVIKY